MHGGEKTSKRHKRTNARRVFFGARGVHQSLMFLCGIKFHLRADAIAATSSSLVSTSLNYLGLANSVSESSASMGWVRVWQRVVFSVIPAP